MVGCHGGGVVVGTVGGGRYTSAGTVDA